MKNKIVHFFLVITIGFFIPLSSMCWSSGVSVSQVWERVYSTGATILKNLSGQTILSVSSTGKISGLNATNMTLTSPLPVLSGGTGNSTAASARANLGAAAYVMSPIAISSNQTMTSSQMYNQIWQFSANATVTMDNCTAGMNFLAVVKGSSIKAYLKPRYATPIRLNGTALTAGHRLTNPKAADDAVSIYCDGTNWMVVGGASTWIDGS